MNKKILIIGGGAAGYFTALRYKNVFKNYQIDLVQSKNINIIGVGESSIIDIPNFLFSDCDIDIQNFHEELNPSFKLGVQTRDWHKNKTINYTFDFMYLMNIYGIDIIYNIQNINYSFFSTLINNKKPPITKNNQLIVGNSIESPYLHAYQIENKKFIPYLQKQAKLKGINEIEGEISNLEYENEKIKSIYFNEDWHTYDFYIDCSGFKSFINNFIKNEWVSFKDYIICDSAIVGEHEINETPNQCTVSHAMSNGWMFQIDSHGRTGKGYVYSSATISEEMALDEYLKKNEMKIKNHKKISFKTGYYKNIFNRNYCFVGTSAGFADPLEATNYTVIINTINLLIKNHLKKENNLFLTESEIHNNNTFMNKLWQEIINVIIMNYKFSDNHKNNFWDFYKKINFIGDFQYLLKYLIENDFSFDVVRELQISYGKNIFLPIELFLLFLTGKGIINKKNKIDRSDYFIKKNEEIINYDQILKEKKYKEYFNNKINIFNFLNQ
jgi:tryptophan halogenase